jgi:hypothetical protein
MAGIPGATGRGCDGLQLRHTLILILIKAICLAWKHQLASHTQVKAHYYYNCAGFADRAFTKVSLKHLPTGYLHRVTVVHTI